MADFDVDALLDQQLEEKRRATSNGEHRKSRHSDAENDRPRSRDRDRDRDRGNRDRDRERDRDRHRDRERDRRDDRARSADRVRSRDHREKDRERGEHKSSRSESRGGNNDNRDSRAEPRSHGHERGEADADLRRGTREPARARKQRTPTPERELREMQRMACTIMAYGLSVIAGEYDVFEFFSQAGEVVDVRMIMDKHTHRHKGIAYIEYKDRSDFLNALQLNGKPLKGMPVNVKAAEAEKNFAWEAQELQKRQNRVAADPGSSIVEAGGPTYIKVENIPNVGLSEEDVKPIFEAFGTVQNLKFEKDRGGQFTGVVYVQYPTAPEGRKAQLGLDSSTALGGPPLAISIVETPMYISNNAYPGELDEGDEAGGMKLNASARTALMGRMSGAAGIERPKEAPLPPPPATKQAAAVHVDTAVEVEKGLVGSASPRPTQCLLLKNMFSPEEEEGESWPEEIAQDTRSECEKFGSVLHIHVDRNSRGFVYLKFGTDDAAIAAQKALHGRWYSHKQIIADFQFTQLYNRYFNL